MGAGRDSKLDEYLNLNRSRSRAPTLKGRAELVAGIVGELGVECARVIEEKVDLQFRAIKRLHRAVDTGTFLKLVIANSVVSYQLTGKGEDWWEEFSSYFSERAKRDVSIADEYERFLPASRTNRRLVSVKVKRLRRMEQFLNELSLDELRRFYFSGMEELRDAIASSLGARKDSKTVVFAVKMFGYAGRIAFGRFVPYPMGIPIPADSRIIRYTAKLTDEPPAEFWNRIAEVTGVPPLHIDSILWPVLGRKAEVIERLKAACGPERYGMIEALMNI
ncbi:MAG: N-glycosylase/DNA lyase [Thermococci archaeon]|nr:N-glycosylase/DNA lyase [Thermococci archaeon]